MQPEIEGDCGRHVGGICRAGDLDGERLQLFDQILHERQDPFFDPRRAVGLEHLDAFGQPERAHIVAEAADLENARVPVERERVERGALRIFQIGDEIAMIFFRDRRVEIGVGHGLQLGDQLLGDVQEAHAERIAEPFLAARAVEVRTGLLHVDLHRADLLDSVDDQQRAVPVRGLGQRRNVHAEAVDLLHRRCDDDRRMLVHLRLIVRGLHRAAVRADAPDLKADFLLPPLDAEDGRLIFQIADQDVVFLFQWKDAREDLERVGGALHEGDLLRLAVDQARHGRARLFIVAAHGAVAVARRDIGVAQEIDHRLRRL